MSRLHVMRPPARRRPVLHRTAARRSTPATPDGTPVSTPSRRPATARPTDWRTDTAERQADPGSGRPAHPAGAVAPPPPPRYPLYADEVDRVRVVRRRSTTAASADAAAGGTDLTGRPDLAADYERRMVPAEPWVRRTTDD